MRSAISFALSVFGRRMRRWPIKNRVISPLSVALLVSACGGGGGNTTTSIAGAPGGGSTDQRLAGPTSPNVPTAAGFWVGAASDRLFDPRIILLDTGAIWVVYGGGETGNALSGLIAGTVSWDGSRIASVSATDFSMRAHTRALSDFNGSYSAKTALNAASTVRSAPVSFATTYRSTFDEPADLAELKGYWQVQSLRLNGGGTLDVTFASSGLMTIVNGTTTCSATGAAMPSASGKNVFDLSFSFANASCGPSSGQSFSGIAFTQGAGLTANLIIAVVRPDGSDALIGYGSR